jgi:hypothetical protein
MKTLLLLTIFYSFIGYSQSSTIQLSEPFSYNSEKKVYYVTDKDNIVSISLTYKNKILFKQWDIKTLKELSFQYEIDTLKIQNINVKKIQEKTYLFYSTMNVISGNIEFYGREIDIANLEFNGDSKLLLTSPFVDNTIYLQLSFDYTSFSLEYHDTIHFYDKNLNKKTDHMYSSNTNSYLSCFSLGENNNIFLKNYWNSPSSMNHELTTIDKIKTKTTVSQIELALTDKKIKTGVTRSNGNQFLSIGFYGNSSNVRPNRTDGIFAIKFDKEGKILYNKCYKFTQDILELHNSNNNNYFMNLKNTNVNLQKDGSVIIIGEEIDYQNFTSTPGSTGFQQTSTIPRFSDIIITKIDNYGELIWVKKIAKRQTDGRGQGAKSFYYSMNNDTHSFIYLDHKKNFDLANNKKPVLYRDLKDGDVILYTVNDKTGESTKTILFNTKEFKFIKRVYFDTNRIIKVSPHKVIIDLHIGGGKRILLKVNI